MSAKESGAKGSNPVSTTTTNPERSVGFSVVIAIIALLVATAIVRSYGELLITWTGPLGGS